MPEKCHKPDQRIMCENDPEGWVSKNELYESFKQYCQSKNIPLRQLNSFGRALQDQIHFRVVSMRPVIKGNRVRGCQGIKWKEGDGEG